MMIAGIVHIDVDDCHRGIVAFQLFQHLFCRQRIDLLSFHKGEVEGLKIKRPLDVKPSTP